MRITKAQAMTEREFHVARPGKSCEIWRRNGRTQTWKTRPGEFRVPVKWGLYSYGQITQDDAGRIDHVGSECPLNIG